MSPRLPHVVGVALLLLMPSACADGVGTTTLPNETTTSSVTTTDAGMTTTIPEPTTVAPDAAPPELRGVWTTELNSTETMRLTLQESSYQANIQGSPETGTGRISVDGDSIEFYGSDRCSEDPGGNYTWVLEGGSLTFTLIGADPCGRVGFLDGHSYTLLSVLP